MTCIFEEHSVSDLVSVLFDGFVNGFDAVSGGVGHGLLYGNAANGGYGGNGHGVYGGRGHRVGQWSVTEVVQWIVSARCVSQSRVERCSSSDGHQSGEDNLQYQKYFLLFFVFKLVFRVFEDLPWRTSY